MQLVTCVAGVAPGLVVVAPRMTHSVKLIDDTLGWCDAGLEVRPLLSLNRLEVRPLLSLRACGGAS